MKRPRLHFILALSAMLSGCGGNVTEKGTALRDDNGKIYTEEMLESDNAFAHYFDPAYESNIYGNGEALEGRAPTRGVINEPIPLRIYCGIAPANANRNPADFALTMSVRTYVNCVGSEQRDLLTLPSYGDADYSYDVYRFANRNEKVAIYHFSFVYQFDFQAIYQKLLSQDGILDAEWIPQQIFAMSFYLDFRPYAGVEPLQNSYLENYQYLEMGFDLYCRCLDGKNLYISSQRENLTIKKLTGKDDDVEEPYNDDGGIHV